VHGEQSAAAVA